ncbi:MAG: hypothetical protein AB7G87_12635 [Clostridia bacterium]
MNCTALENIGVVVSTLSILFTAIIAFLGLRSWKQEMKGRADFEVARQIMRSTYRITRELNASRSPLQTLSFPRDKEINPKDANLYAEQELYNKLMHPISEAYIEFESSSLDAQVLWGEEFLELARNLKKCVFDFQLALEENLENIKYDGEIFLGNQKLRKENMNIRFNTSEKNPFTIKIDKSVKAIELFIKPKLKTKF